LAVEALEIGRLTNPQGAISRWLGKVVRAVPLGLRTAVRLADRFPASRVGEWLTYRVLDPAQGRKPSRAEKRLRKAETKRHRAEAKRRRAEAKRRRAATRPAKAVA
jgi:hypothetical protein